MQTSGEPVQQPLATRHYSGSFTVRIPPEVHRQIAIKAAEANISLNRFVSYKLTAP
jgi:predicted HicB family RNase H-like nuclease